MITERMAFVDSRSETLIQAVAISTSFLRRLLARKVAGDEIARAVGKLRINRMRGRDRQSLRMLTISRPPRGQTSLVKVLRTMTGASRSLMRRARRTAA